ncbi:hypothetical protein LZ31DRAFT_365196 [Colletotrichum somersetense]|nr:hypothetical protein LZ31DRAFT_365196 [Colletotrichum somersetense]
MSKLFSAHISFTPHFRSEVFTLLELLSDPRILQCKRRPREEEEKRRGVYGGGDGDEKSRGGPIWAGLEVFPKLSHVTAVHSLLFSILFSRYSFVMRLGMALLKKFPEIKCWGANYCTLNSTGEAFLLYD